MANTVFGIQISIPSGVKTPIVTTDRRLTLHNLVNLLAGGLNAGRASGLSGASAYVQVQTSLVAASATATPAAVAANDTLSIGGTALTATQKRATGTITCATALAAQTITINGVVFTAVAGAATLGEATFSIDTSDAATATSIIAQVNAYASPLLSGIVAARATVGNTARVTFYAITQGTAGNSITLASSDNGTLAVSAAALANGAALTNNAFDWAGTDITTGQALAAAIIASTTAAIQRTTATASSSTGIVTVSAKEAGDAGEVITFTSSDATRLAVTGSGYLASGSASAVTRWSF